MKTTMVRYPSLREAQADAKTHPVECRDGDTYGSAYVLRRDGDTDCYTMQQGRVTRNRMAGHKTCGMWIDPTDLPCVVYRTGI